MTSALKQACSEHAVASGCFPPIRDSSVLPSQFSHFWYSDRPPLESSSAQSPCELLGSTTPPICKGTLKAEVDVEADSAKCKEKAVLPHWMESRRGQNHQGTRAESTPEAGPPTPMKGPTLPKHLNETPNSVLHFSSSSSGLHVGLSGSDQRKCTWPRQATVTDSPSGGYHVSRISEPSGLFQDSVQSQKENVSSLAMCKATRKAMPSPHNGNSSLSSCGSFVGSPMSARIWTTLGSPRKSILAADDLQLHLHNDPASRIPSNENGDFRGYHNLSLVETSVTNQTSALRGQKCALQAKPDSLASFVHGSMRSMVKSSRLRECHQDLQAEVRIESSLGHEDLCLTLQPASEPATGSSRGCRDEPSGVHTPMCGHARASNFVGEQSQTKCVSLDASAPRTQADNSLLFHLLPREGGVSDTDTVERVEQEFGTSLKKRKESKKLLKKDVSGFSPSPSIESSSPFEYRNQRVKKRVKKEVVELPNSAFCTKKSVDVANRALEISLGSTAVASHPTKHNFFPDKVDVCSPETRFKQPIASRRVVTSTQDSSNHNLRSGKSVTDISPRESDSSLVSSHSQVVPVGNTFLPLVAGADLQTRDVPPGFGIVVPRSVSVLESLKSLPQVVKHLEEQAEDLVESGDVSRHRSKFLTVPAHAPMPLPCTTFSSGEPSLSLSFSQKKLSGAAVHGGRNSLGAVGSPEEEWGKSLALSATPIAVTPQQATDGQGEGAMGYQDRFVLLQSYLKQCDQGDQGDLLKALRALSPAARSGHAVDLETRAMWLSIEEGKEMNRVKMLNVMGWNMGSAQVMPNEEGVTLRGRQLSVPGSTTTGSSDISLASPGVQLSSISISLADC